MELTFDTSIELEELVEIIKSQWDKGKIFELIKKLDEEMGSFEITKRLRDHFDKMYNIDLAEKEDTVNGPIQDQEEITTLGDGGRCFTPHEWNL